MNLDIYFKNKLRSKLIMLTHFGEQFWPLQDLFIIQGIYL